MFRWRWLSQAELGPVFVIKYNSTPFPLEELSIVCKAEQLETSLSLANLHVIYEVEPNYTTIIFDEINPISE